MVKVVWIIIEVKWDSGPLCKTLSHFCLTCIDFTIIGLPYTQRVCPTIPNKDNSFQCNIERLPAAHPTHPAAHSPAYPRTHLMSSVC